MLIKGVTVVRTAKGSGHVLVTTADQVFTIFSLWLHFDRCIMLFCCLCGWIKADHLQPDSLLSPFPLRQGEILWPVRRSSGAISSNVALTMCTSRKNGIGFSLFIQNQKCFQPSTTFLHSYLLEKADIFKEKSRRTRIVHGTLVKNCVEAPKPGLRTHRQPSSRCRLNFKHNRQY